MLRLRCPDILTCVRDALSVRTGAISVSFGLFSRITRLKDRVFTFSCARTWMSLAYMLAPGLAALFAIASCTCDASQIIGSAYLNQYTLPGYATAGFSFLVFVAVLAQFENPPSGGPKQVVKVFFNRGLFVLILSSFLASFVVGAFSAILVPVTTHNYNWGDLDNRCVCVWTEDEVTVPPSRWH